MSAERKVFGKLQGMTSPMPDLIDIQTKSYQEFLQADVAPQKRKNEGLQEIFKEIFPIVSYDGRYKLDFVGYNLEPENCYTVGEICKKYRINDSTVWAHVRKYSIPSRQIGNYVYIPKDEIDNLYKSDIL